MKTHPMDEMRCLRDDLATLADKFERLAKEPGFRHIGKGTAHQLSEALYDLDGWMGWEEG